MPQLALALRRGYDDIPDQLKTVGGMGGRHVGTLVSLATIGPGTVGELADRLDMTPAHTSLVVGELARAGYVDRQHDNADRRRIVVALTDKSKPLLDQMRKRRAAPLRRFLANLSEQDAEIFIDQLQQLVSALQHDPT
jgi:DNA-binding MarR family transcriptional regulator